MPPNSTLPPLGKTIPKSSSEFQNVRSQLDQSTVLSCSSLSFTIQDSKKEICILFWPSSAGADIQKHATLKQETMYDHYDYLLIAKFVQYPFKVMLVGS